MDIQIETHNENTTNVIIKCRQVDDEILRLKTHIELFDNTLKAKKENETYLIHSSDVLYFESVDNRTFLYTEDNVMEIGHRLYELEQILPTQD